MTSKKKLGSKLANSVRQVKLQREQTPVVPAKTVTPAKTANKPAAAVAPTKPVAPQAHKKTDLGSLHPQRIWPD